MDMPERDVERITHLIATLATVKINLAHAGHFIPDSLNVAFEDLCALLAKAVAAEKMELTSA